MPLDRIDVLCMMEHSSKGIEPLQEVALYHVIPTLSKERTTRRLLLDRTGVSSVLLATPYRVERLTTMLRHTSRREDVFFYHTDLSKQEKSRVKKWFLSTSHGVLISTRIPESALLTRPVSLRIHYDLPFFVDSYLSPFERRCLPPANALLFDSSEEVKRKSLCLDASALDQFLSLWEVVTQKSRCRWQGFQKLMERECPPCSACDVCLHKTLSLPEGERCIRNFVGRHPRRVPLRGASLALKGYRRDNQGLSLLSYFGALSSWEMEEIETALTSLLARDILRRPAKGPWKGLLSLQDKGG